MTHSLKIALKDVFNPFLKPVKDGDLRKSNGSEFHSLGAHTEKALFPEVFVNDRGCSNRCGPQVPGMRLITKSVRLGPVARSMVSVKERLIP